MLSNRKVAVVTGGANGIGLSCTIKFLQQDYVVICVDIDELALEVVRKRYKSDQLVVQKVNVSLEPDVSLLSNFVGQNYAKVEALVNCAGIQTYGSLNETTEHLWDSTFNVNLKSMFFMAKYFVPLMKKKWKRVHCQSIFGPILSKSKGSACICCFKRGNQRLLAGFSN